MTVRIERTRLSDPRVGDLIAELDTELTERYPEPGATHFRLEPAEVGDGRGVLLIAVTETTGAALGCGALRLLDPDVAELKRVYVRPSARGDGLGGRLLAELEHHAVRLGARRVVLETGARQDEALRMYTRAGYRAIAPFGEYTHAPLSVCLGKTPAVTTSAAGW